MLEQALASVFANAAVPQKIVLVVLAGAIPLTLVAAVRAVLIEERGGPWRRLIADVRLAGPALGLLAGAMNAFHIAQTIQRAPFDPTARQLAPGILEVSALVGLGALAGLVAAFAQSVLAWAAARPRW